MMTLVSGPSRLDLAWKRAELSRRIAALAIRAKQAGHYDPSEPRDNHGRWTKLVRNEDKWTTETGEKLPEHVESLHIPPAWQHVEVATDPKADLRAKGYDTKGRQVRIYSEAFKAEQARLKFERNRELMGKHTQIYGKLLKDIGRDETREAAACMLLIYKMGLRPGSDRDTKAEKKAYGATTLTADHVVEDSQGMRLVFTGKKGVDLNLPVNDQELKHMLRERKAKGGKLFGVDDGQLRDYAHTLGGGGFKVKDFRTLRGTLVARQVMGKTPQRAENEKIYRKRVMAIAKEVAAVLGNTPTIALQSYINPLVFEPIKPILAA